MLSSIFGQFNQIAKLPTKLITIWLTKLIDSFKTLSSSSSTATIDQDILLLNRYTLRQLAIYLSYESSKSESFSTLCLSIISALITLASLQLKENESSKDIFPELLVVLDILGASNQGNAYLNIFESCCTWLEQFSNTNLDSQSDSKLIKSTSYILSYICEILNTVKSTSKSSGVLNLINVEPSITDDVEKLVQKSLRVDFFLDTIKLFEKVQTSLPSSSGINRCESRVEKKKPQSQWSRGSIKRPRKSSVVKKDKKNMETNPFGEEMEDGEEITDEAVLAAPDAHENEDGDNFYDDINIDDTCNDQEDEDVNEEMVERAKPSMKRNEEDDEEESGGDRAANDDDDDDNDDDDDDDNYYDFEDKQVNRQNPSSLKNLPQVSTSNPSREASSEHQARKKMFDIKYYQDDEDIPEDDDQEPIEDPDDDEDMDPDEDDDERVMNNEGLSKKSNNEVESASGQEAQSSGLVATLNRIDMNDLFSLGFVEELSAVAAAAAGTRRHDEHNQLAVTGELEDDQDDENEGDEEEDDEYGDDFNDNFADYENIRLQIPESISQQSRPNLNNIGI